MKSNTSKPTVVMLAAICTIAIAPTSYAGNACEVKSGVATAALVELYTSEGCSSCPPADKQLSRLRQISDSNAVIVPLALHVSYWDAIGWKDGFAQKTFDARQSELLVNRKNRVVYTPQFFVNGNELRGWQSDLSNQIRQINAKPAPLAIILKSKALADNRIAVSAEVLAPEARADAVLYLAISESDLSSRVTHGENSGTTLKHDDTVRLWFGPMALAQGNGRMQQEIDIPAAWNREHLQAVAFVQDQRNGNVLQAVSTAQCKSSKGL